MGLVTLAEVKTFAGVSDSTYDAFLTMQIDLISDAVEEYCRRRFMRTKYAETFMWTHAIDPTLTTTHYPIISVESVSDVENTEYLVHKATGRLIPKRPHSFLAHRDSITVVYEAGFDPGALPNPIKYAVLSLIGGNLSKKRSGVDLSFGSDVQRVSIPGTISIDFDYTLQNNEPNRQFGLILGSMVNVIAPYISDRAVVGNDKISFLEVVP